MGKMIDLITDRELQVIDEYRDNFIGADDSDGTRRASTKDILSLWESQKADLFELMGEKLRVSFPVCIRRENSSMVEEIQRQKDNSIGAFSNFSSEIYGLCYRNSNNSYFNMLELIDPLMDADNLVANKVTWREGLFDGKKFYKFPLMDGKDITVQYGCSPIKVLGKIAQNFGLRYFEEFRIAHSMILNDKALKGDLVISIHPLDFITMSDSGSSWTSCMNWREEGCYRRGTVEMMNSSNGVCCYLAPSNPNFRQFSLFEDSNYNIDDDFKIDRKKWRELFIVDKHLIAGVKGYPYQSKGLVKECISHLAQLAHDNMGWNLSINNFTEYHYPFLDIGGKNYHLSFCTNEAMYNDFGTTNNNYIIIDPDYKGSFDLIYSGPSQCMWCGEKEPSFEDESSLICNDCGNFIYCDNCGSIISVRGGDGYCEVDGSILCENCYENDTFCDPIIEEVHLNENGTALYIIPDDAKGIDLLTDASIYLYDDTLNCSNLLEPYFTSNSAIEVVDSYRENYYRNSKNAVRISNCTEDGLSLFGFSSVKDYYDSIKYRSYKGQ